jgi:hypothetical protein
LVGVKWDLDLWYEVWDRAGSQGLDTWYELPHGKRKGGGRDAHPPSDIDGLDATCSPSEPTEGSQVGSMSVCDESGIQTGGIGP